MHLSWTRIAGLAVISVCLLMMAGTTWAGVENYVANDVWYWMSEGAAYTYHTTNEPGNETATVQFHAAFDVAQTGYMQGAEIMFTYDPTRATLIAARPASGWGTVTPLLDTSVGGLVTVFYGLDPVPGTSTIPISETETLLAEFDFRMECQTSPITSSVGIITGTAGTKLDDGTDTHYLTTTSGRSFNGSVRPVRPHWAAWLGDTFGELEIPGALGKVIDVPIFVGGPFRLAEADMVFSYDVNKLQFLGLSELDSTVTSAPYSYPTSGQVQVHFYTDEAVMPRHQFTSDVIANLQFRVVNAWQGGSAFVGWVQNPIFTIAQDAGTCGVPFANGIAVGCTINIPAYLAELTTEFTDGGTLSINDNQVTMMIKMNNNFPAGRGWKSIITNVCLGESLEKDGGITYEAIDFGALTYDGANGQEVSLFTEAGTGFMPMVETPQNMVSFNIETVSGFTPPNSFDNRIFPITYQTSFDSDPTYNARVKDTTGLVTTTNVAGTLTWDTPEVEYMMGEYYCPSVQSGTGLIAQDFYTRNSFDLHDFRVKIVVSGNHSIYDIAVQPGVEIEEIDSVSLKWAILKSGASWDDQEATDTRVKFATFTYAYWTQQHMLNLDQPSDGYWVTKSSTVSFVYDSPSGYFMKNTSDQDEHEVAIGGTVVSRWWVDLNPDPEPQFNSMAGTDGLPIEFALLQNYPNPFNPTTAFWYALPEGAYVEVSVYNITGQKVATLSEGWREAGFYNATWDGSEVASGVYFYRLVTDKFTQSKKMILLK